jgi:GNAT superfamily N-acetyltransferase
MVPGSGGVQRLSSEADGLFLPAWLQDHPIGCGALKFHGSGPTEIKRMWVSPDARGLGIGRQR